MSEWQPGDSAPRDGSKIVVKTIDGRHEVVSWQRREFADALIVEGFFPLHQTPIVKPEEIEKWVKAPDEARAYLRGADGKIWGLA